MHFQLPVCYVLVSSHLRLYLVVFCLCFFNTAAQPAAAERLRVVSFLRSVNIFTGRIFSGYEKLF